MRYFLLLFLLHHATSQADDPYRFVCNGILANGMERNDHDECGPCDAETAARWPNPRIGVTISPSPRPHGISLEAWLKVARQSLRAWDSVSGTSLRFIELDQHNPREFGANEYVHEIMWVTSKDEWRKLIGSGEYNILGATIPRYTCKGDGQGGKRIMLDADLMLNGMSHINWQIDCDNENCLSIQSTLVHELGHFIGLDHPCLLCENSIMSARAGYEFESPLFDDIQGLRVLYPDASGAGLFGFACASNSDCADRHQCIFDGENSYCSTNCIDDSECGVGSSCRENASGKHCVFAGLEESAAKDLDQNCTRAPCMEPLVCAGAFEPHFYCFSPCETERSCQAGQECIKVRGGKSICIGIKKLHESCNHRELCDEHLYCVFNGLNSGFCRKPCEATMTSSTGCAPGFACRLIDNRAELCMPIEDDFLLDTHSASFNANPNVGDRNKALENNNNKAAPSCASRDVRAVNNWWRVVCLAFLGLRRKRPRHLPFI